MGDFVGEYDQLLAGMFQRYLDLSAKIGGVVKEQADLVNGAFRAQRSILALASDFNKPENNGQLEAIMKPMSDKMVDIQNHRGKHRTSEFFNHLSTVSESIAVLGWVVVTPDPSKFAKELHAAGAYYGNKVITTYKNKDPTHSDWAKTWLDVLSDLHTYIREYHRCGLSWNARAAPATSSSVQSGGIPAPPPPPPPGLFDAPVASSDDPRAALFKEINQGEDITRCLKKVDKTVKQEKPAVSVHSAKWHKPAAAPEAKPPKFVLDGRKWCIEYQQGAKLSVSDATMNQHVCIYKCDNSFITVEKKVNCVTLDSCKRTSVVFNDVVSFVEFINCQNVKAQSLGTLPTMMIDKTDGAQLYLNEKSFDAEIISSKSSELNISIPKGDDYVELAVPEQFKTVVVGGTLKTVAVEKL